MASAFIGQPPNTQDDYWIVLGIIRRLGLPNHDPAKGILFPPARPLNDHYRSRAPQMLAANAICIILIILITGSRLLIRGLYRGVQWGWDDWLIGLAALVVLAWCSGSTATVVYGGRGKHIWDVTYREYYYYSRITYVTTFFYIPGAILIKMSIVCFNRRIIGLASTFWRRINNAFLVLLVMFMIAYVTYIGAICPSNKLDLIQTGKAKSFKYCGNKPISLKMGLAMAGIHVTLGWCLLLTPIIVLWKIQMNWRKKIPVFIVFAVGSISCISSVMIVVTAFQIHSDATWTSMQLFTWILLDLFFGTIVASLPILYGQLPTTWTRFKAYTRSYGQSTSGHRELRDTPPEPMSKRKGGEDGEIYVHTDIESHGNRVDDQVELLGQPPRRPAGALTSPPDHIPNLGVHITGRGDMDHEIFGKQPWFNESLESTTATPSMKN